MQKILVTGGAGFIGSHLAKELVRLGNEVIVYDYRTDWASVSEIRNEVQCVEGDVRDLEKVRRTVLSVDGIVHVKSSFQVLPFANSLLQKTICVLETFLPSLRCTGKYLFKKSSFLHIAGEKMKNQIPLNNIYFAAITPFRNLLRH